MSQAYRFPVLCIVLGMAAAGRAGAQEPEARPRAERDFIMRAPRFEYRMPRLMLRMQPRLRLDAAELRLRALDRSFDRMEQMRERRFMLQDRLRARQFGLQDRTWRRQFELRDRIQERMRERMDRYPSWTPFRFGPRSRTI